MKIRWLVAAAALFFGLAPASFAQVHSPPPSNTNLLAFTWYENEGLWRGIWVPARPDSRDGAYSAHWTLIGHSDQESAGLTITIDDREVTVQRVGRNARCTYHGVVAPDRRSITGTYSCNTAPQPMRWSVTFGNQQIPASELESWNANEYLRYTWLEREGAWRGTWTPIDRNVGDGHYHGTWSQPPNVGAVSAELSITAQPGGHFTIQRTQAQGSCTYQGDFAYSGGGPNNTNVSGTYTCDWARTPLPWSAVIQLPPQRR